MLAVAQIATLDEVLELACAETAGGRGEFKGPQEVGRLLEVGANSEDLVNQVLNRNDTILAELLLNESVVGLGSRLEYSCGYRSTQLSGNLLHTKGILW